MNDRGFTLIEVMMAMFIGSMVGYAIMGFVYLGENGSIKTRRETELSGLYGTLILAGSRPKTCKMMLAGQPFSVSGPQEIALNLPGHSSLKKGVTWSGWLFESVRLEYDKLIEPNLHYAVVVLEVSRMPKTAPVPPRFLRNTLIFKTDASDTVIESCNPSPEGS